MPDLKKKERIEMEAYGKIFKKDEIFLLRKLADKYHTLPLSKEELACVLNGAFNSEKVYTLLSRAEKMKLFHSTFFAGRKLVYLDSRKLRVKPS